MGGVRQQGGLSGVGEAVEHGKDGLLHGIGNLEFVLKGEHSSSHSWRPPRPSSPLFLLEFGVELSLLLDLFASIHIHAELAQDTHLHIVIVRVINGGVHG